MDALFTTRDVNIEDTEGRTPLWWAARSGHAGIARLLLAEDCEMNKEDKQNRTPLHVAALYGHEEV
ncbi:ankyrin, partial [Clathrospora elynae]